jgi:hypothetical protein
LSGLFGLGKKTDLIADWYFAGVELATFADDLSARSALLQMLLASLVVMQLTIFDGAPSSMTPHLRCIEIRWEYFCSTLRSDMAAAVLS